MTGNPLPWIVLAAVVAATLFLKGYVKLPTGRPASPQTGASIQAPQSAPGVDVDALAKLGSYVLGLAFAKAVRLEAESVLTNKVARDATDAMTAMFTAPFSAPASAGPAQPAGPPTP